METETYGIVLILIGLIVATLASSLVFIFLSYKAKLLKIEKEKQFIAFKAAVEAEEEQKEKIAKDLHDEAISTLTVSSRSMDEFLSTYPDPNNLPKELLHSKEKVNQAITEIRDIVNGIIPITFFNFGLIRAFELYIITLNTAADTELANNTPFGKELPFLKTEQQSIYRIFRELITNLCKHAQYTYLRITIDSIGNALLLTFEHDGKGVTDKEIEMFRNNSTGVGLNSIESRRIILNATINYLIGTDTSKIVLRIPFTK